MKICHVENFSTWQSDKWRIFSTWKVRKVLTMQNIYFVWSSPLHCPTRSWKPFILFSARRFSSFITRKYHHTATLISYKCMGLDGIDPTLKTSPPILVFGFGQSYIYLLLPPKDTFLWTYVVWEDTYLSLNIAGSQMRWKWYEWTASILWAPFCHRFDFYYRI